MSPIEHSREFHSLDSAFDSKSDEEAVEISFDGALGNVEIASDFRVVASLEQKIDDLPLPGSHLAEIFVHVPLPDTPGRPSLGSDQVWIDLTVSFCMHAANPGLVYEKNVKFHNIYDFYRKNQQNQGLL